jgi:hypothetical protein
MSEVEKLFISPKTADDISQQFLITSDSSSNRISLNLIPEELLRLRPPYLSDGT